jgi:hypothetical protein
MKQLRRKKQERKAMIMRTRNLSNKQSWLMKTRRNRPMKGKTTNTNKKMKMMENGMKLSFKNKIVYKKKMLKIKKTICRPMRLMLSSKKRTTMSRKRMRHSRSRKKTNRQKRLTFSLEMLV